MSPVPEPLAVIRAATRLVPVPLVPEIRLHLASEPISLWEQTEQDLGQTGLAPPYWGFAWAGGQALARYLLDRPDLVAGRRVIDLASGSGLVAIAAARAGAAAVTAYDVDPVAVAAIGINAAANGVAVTAIRADILDADQPAAGPSAADPSADDPAAAGLVLAADAWYERELAGRLLRFLELARAGGADVLVADPGRAYLPRHRFTRLAAYRVPGTGALEGSDAKTALVLAPTW
ncbi:MAG: methyltransferase [Actinobacteria bacterium]|nr:methyltransferase [Actinomycetota bacterium]